MSDITVEKTRETSLYKFLMKNMGVEDAELYCLGHSGWITQEEHSFYIACMDILAKSAGKVKAKSLSEYYGEQAV